MLCGSPPPGPTLPAPDLSFYGDSETDAPSYRMKDFDFDQKETEDKASQTFDEDDTATQSDVNEVNSVSTEEQKHSELSKPKDTEWVKIRMRDLEKIVSNSRVKVRYYFVLSLKVK